MIRYFTLAILSIALLFSACGEEATSEKEETTKEPVQDTNTVVESDTGQTALEMAPYEEPEIWPMEVNAMKGQEVLEDQYAREFALMGWSEDGRLAYLKGDGKIGTERKDYVLDLYLQDLVTDKKLTLAKDKVMQEQRSEKAANEGRYRLMGSWKALEGRYKNALSKYNVTAITGSVIESNEVTWGDNTFKISFESQEIESTFKHTITITSDTGLEVVLYKGEGNLEANEVFSNIYFLGYVLSPDKEKMAILAGTKTMSYYGDVHEVMPVGCTFSLIK
jgi:hypothetical protein